MSVQKLIAEAEKLLDKKKVPDAIERLKSALALEPLNQLVTTRLANIYLDQNDRASAGKAYADLAQRNSEAGKSAIAIAVYKQAIEINPDNVELRVVYARECEEMGKVGDAQNQAQAALQHYLQRKKYLDAAGVMPLLLRLNNRDDLKAAWIEVLQLSQGEQKLIHLLVALCGPPGLVSTEFNVGGDASTLSEGIYESLKSLAKWFPRDPRIAYAVAWAAQRRGRKKDFYDNIRECLRREPDFCLGYLLLARTLAEEERLSEALFIFKVLKERLPADRSIDMVTLNRLVDSFVDKSPWITMGESGGAKELEPAEFLNFVRGGSAPAPAPAPAVPAPPPSLPTAPAAAASAAPDPFVAQVGDVSFSIDADMSPAAEAPRTQEVSVSLAEVSVASAAIEAPAAAPAVVPPAVPEPVILVAREAPAPVAVMVPSAAEPVAAPPARPVVSAPPVVAAPERDDSVEFTNIIKVSPEFQAGLDSELEFAEGAAPAGEIDPSSLLLAADSAPEELSPAPEAEAIASAPAPSPAPKGGFNPLEVLDQESVTRALEGREEKTEMFSPMDVLSAKDSAREKFDVKTRIIEDAAPAPAASATPATEPAAPAPATYDGLYLEGEATQIFSPMEAVSAAGDSRRPLEKNAPAPKPAPVGPAKILPETGALTVDTETGDATTVLQMPAAAPLAASSLAASAEAPAPVGVSLPAGEADGATQVMSAQDILPADLFSGLDAIEAAISEASEATAVMTPDEGPIAAPAPVVVFQPIPQVNAAPKKVAPAEAAPPANASPAFAPAPAQDPAPASAAGQEEIVDLGDDLLQEPTRVLIVPPKLPDAVPESTRHLLQEIRKEVRENKANAPDADAMLRRAERYIVKQNFYLARKALRLALELGAEEERVKSRLRDIRKIELPTGLYTSSSHDEGKRERSTEILERLESEFGIGEADEESTDHLSETVNGQLERIFRESDPRTILDFGVGLHEMGLFRQAEDVFTRITTEFPELAFDAYYLAAVTKFSRRDYAGAASILKHLSAEVGRSEEEKIQIYYTLGELFERMQRPDSSREFFKKVAQLDSNYRNVRHKLES